MRLNSNRLLPAGCVLVLAAGLVSAQEDPGPDQVVTWSDLLSPDSTLRFYGFLRLDSMYDDSRMNDPQIPYLVRSEHQGAPPAGAPAGTIAPNDNDELAFSARLTRLGATFEKGERLSALCHPKLSGKVEIDFYNIGLGDSDSRSALRMRLAYLTLQWTNWSLLAGQAWDVISPLYPVVNNDLVMWGAGNTGDRRPQATLKHVAAVGPGRIETQFGAALTGAVGGSTVIGGLRSGENSGRPMLHGRVGYHGKTDSGGAYQLGVWAHDSEEEFDALGTGGEQTYDSSSLGFDARAPLWSDLAWVQGEWFRGENLRDIRGGILQGVNGNTGREIEAEGGWIEGAVRVTEHATAYLGYSFDDPEDSDLSAFMPSKNTVPYAAVRWRYDSLRFGVELLDWETEYMGLASGDAMRFVLWIAYYF